MTRAFWLLGALLTLAGCKTGATASFPVGVEVSVDASELSLPEALRDGSTIASVPCGPMGMCPTSAEAPITCEAGVCDPAPRTVSLLVGEVDIDEAAGDVGEIFDSIDTLKIDDVTYRIEANTLTVPTTELEIFWGPVTAVGIDESMGVRRLGVMPALAAGATGEGQVVLDAAGSAALTQYFESTSHEFRFFVRTTIDLEPGQPWPEGRLEAAVRMAITLEGSLL
ncbi:MAG: hypothetical protein H6721_03605 [Sandaracinus sp.]|nr:hypothetical protein [Sandaracinus sp.]